MLVNDTYTEENKHIFQKQKLQKNRKRKENLTSSPTSSQAPPGTARVVGAATCAIDGGDLAGTGVDGQLIGTGTNGVLTRADADATTLEGDVGGEVEGNDTGEATRAGDVGLEGGVAGNEARVVAGDVDSVAKGEWPLTAATTMQMSAKENIVFFSILEITHFLLYYGREGLKNKSDDFFFIFLYRIYAGPTYIEV